MRSSWKPRGIRDLAAPAMISWRPIAKKALLARIAQGEARMSPEQRRVWEAIRIEPEKWHQLPFGEPGLGFWAVALIGRSVVWYNDIEEGFNRSRYLAYGTIEDYWANQDELEVAMEYLLTVLNKGPDLVQLLDAPAKRWR
jgi:hypothetical protein